MSERALSPPAAEAYRLRPLDAVRAIRELLRNPEDTAKVFVIVRALSGKSLLRGYNRFAATPTGRDVLASKRSLMDVLSDTDHLASLPAGSLGRVYLDFMKTENLTATGLAEASTSGELPPEPGLRLYAARLRDMHDLWHVATGYGRDTMGEVCLLGFTFGQTRNPGIAFIAVIGALKIAREHDRRILRALWAGFRAGRRAAWLPAADWEHLLALPLDAVRQRLGIEPPRAYPEMRGGRWIRHNRAPSQRGRSIRAAASNYARSTNRGM
ncbi:MAG: Coq4 family protein [Pseudomonadota bacterium]